MRYQTRAGRCIGSTSNAWVSQVSRYPGPALDPSTGPRISPVQADIYMPYLVTLNGWKPSARREGWLERYLAFVVSLVAIAISGGCEPGAAPESAVPSEAVYDLDAEGGSGRSYGSLRITRAEQLCWQLTIEELPKALQIHQDVNGPYDPVVLSLFEPPTEPVERGCRSIDAEITAEIRAQPEVFYVDGHNSDKTRTPVLWAALTPSTR
jgi:hypothetical protein